MQGCKFTVVSRTDVTAHTKTNISFDRARHFLDGDGSRTSHTHETRQGCKLQGAACSENCGMQSTLRHASHTGVETVSVSQNESSSTLKQNATTINVVDFKDHVDLRSCVASDFVAFAATLAAHQVRVRLGVPNTVQNSYTMPIAERVG